MTDGNSCAYFVYYDDGYCDCGHHGLASFPTLEEAIAFIDGRIGKSSPGEEPRSIDNYKLIRGHEVHIEPYEKTTAVRVR